jgi:hypothetical protein
VPPDVRVVDIEELAPRYVPYFLQQKSSRKTMPLVTIATFLTPEDAQVARLALQSEGIPSYLEGAEFVGNLWYLGNATGWVKLQVEKTFEHRAREIFSEEAKEAAIAVMRRCPSCGEEVPGNFAVCWACQTPMDAAPAAKIESSASETEVSSQPHESNLSIADYPPKYIEGDALAWRAFLIAMIGLLLCPPIFQLYSFFQILVIYSLEMPLSYKGKRHYYWALLIDGFVLLFMMFFIGAYLFCEYDLFHFRSLLTPHAEIILNK